MRFSVVSIFDNLLKEHPALEVCRDDILKAYDMLIDCFAEGKMILICGNGGSASDSEHIVGELMKGFNLKRELSKKDKETLKAAFPEEGEILADRLQCALPAVSLVSQTSLSTAFVNDVSADLVFAQQVYGYRHYAGALIGISASGNSANVLNALKTAKAFNIRTIGLTGRSGGLLKDICDVAIKVPAQKIYRIQEYHLPVYHALCAMIEEEFFGQ